MPLLEVKQYPDPILRQPGKPIGKKELKSKEFRRWIKDLIETMYCYDGVGLAAQQVGEAKLVTVIDTCWGDKEKNPLVLINPQIVFLEGEMPSEEGCLSFRAGDVKSEGVLLKSITRARKVKVNFCDLENKKQHIIAENNLLCRCLQHEIDHLNGILFIDRATDRAEVTSELERFGLSEVLASLQAQS